MINDIIVVWEEHRKAKGSTFYYVREGNILRRINEYSLREIKENGFIKYEVTRDSVKGKTIYLFYFTNSGRLIVYAFEGDKFLDWGSKRIVKNEELFQLEIEVVDPLLRRRILEFKRDYVIMISEVKEYASRLGFKIDFLKSASNINRVFKNPELGLFASLSLQNDIARLKSLSVAMKWINQMWVMMLTYNALNIESIRDTIGESRVLIRQGPVNPIFAKRGNECFSIWFEFQRNSMEHILTRKPEKGKAAIRPDIVICKGKHPYANKLEKIDLIIECKNEEFDKWQTDLEKQVIQYLRNYKPDHMILTSTKSIPNNVKQQLKTLGIQIIDDLTPNNKDVIKEFQRVIKTIFP
ncbi:MAG: hypothetical protein QXP50_08105 [Candidatus Methanomethylicia archaeon]